MKKIAFALLLWLSAASAFAQVEDALPPNPFADFETIRLPNGLKVRNSAGVAHLPHDAGVD